MPMAVGGNIDWINRAVHLHWDLFIVNDTLVINSPSACGGDGDNSVKEPNLNLINGTDNAVYIWGTTNGDLIYVIPGNDNILFLSGDDTVYTGSGYNAVLTWDGDDTIAISNLSQVITGGEGTDTVTFHLSELVRDGFEIDLLNGDFKSDNSLQNSTISDFGNIYIKSINAVKFIANELTNVLSSGNGDDHLIAAGAANILIGNGGADTFEINSELATFWPLPCLISVRAKLL